MEDIPRRLAESGAVKIRVRLGSISSGNVLDVATGFGDFIDTLMKAFKEFDAFVGIDVATKDLEVAKKRFRGKPVKFIEMNAKALNFADNSFDTVCMAYSLHHLDRIDKVLKEMHRVAKPGGYLIIQEEFCDGNQTDAQKTSILQHAWDAQIDSLFGETHQTTFTKQSIKDVIDQLPLERVEIFESTHPVECLFCDQKEKCDDPTSEETIMRVLKEIDDTLQRVRNITDPKARGRLRKIGEELKDRNKKFGNAHPSILLTIGRKAS